jgi:hypothetical protein
VTADASRSCTPGNGGKLNSCRPLLDAGQSQRRQPAAGQQDERRRRGRPNALASHGNCELAVGRPLSPRDAHLACHCRVAPTRKLPTSPVILTEPTAAFVTEQCRRRMDLRRRRGDGRRRAEQSSGLSGEQPPRRCKGRRVSGGGTLVEEDQRGGVLEPRTTMSSRASVVAARTRRRQFSDEKQPLAAAKLQSRPGSKQRGGEQRWKLGLTQPSDTSIAAAAAAAAEAR